MQASLTGQSQHRVHKERVSIGLESKRRGKGVCCNITKLRVRARMEVKKGLRPEE